jgi:addiction module RelE/StbE family toxin
MKYKIQFSRRADDDLQYFKVFEQRIIVQAIEEQLTQQPKVETRNRKPLSDNPVASWELRIQHYRVFYDVFDQEKTVKIAAIGYKKHNQLYFKDEEFDI